MRDTGGIRTLRRRRAIFFFFLSLLSSLEDSFVSHTKKIFGER